MNEVLDLIKDYGGYAGAASLLGLAVLALLYFAQAREVKRLREWAGRAPERAAELEARVAAEAARRAAGGTTRPGMPQTAAAKSAVKPATPAPANGQAQQPGAVPAGATAAAGAAAAGAAAATPAAGATAPGKPAEGAAATTAKPSGDTPGDKPAETPGDKPAAVPATTGLAGAPAATPPAEAGKATTAGAPAGGAAAVGGAAAAGGAGAATPPSSPPTGDAPAAPTTGTGESEPPDPSAIEDQDGSGDGLPAEDLTGITPPGPSLPPARTAAARPRGTGPVRPVTAAPARAASIPSATPPLRPGRSRPSTPGGMWRPIAAIAGALVVIIVGIVVLTGGGDDGPQAENTRSEEPRVIPPANEPEPADSDERTPRGEVTVAVLNGTTVPGLAGTVAEKISGAGFDVPGDLVTNAFEQNRSATVVMFSEGNREEALDVARTIDVGSDALDRLDERTRTLTQNRAKVVVTVGADQSQQ